MGSESSSVGALSPPSPPSLPSPPELASLPSTSLSLASCTGSQCPVPSATGGQEKNRGEQENTGENRPLKRNCGRIGEAELYSFEGFRADWENLVSSRASKHPTVSSLIVFLFWLSSEVWHYVVAQNADR